MNRMFIGLVAIALTIAGSAADGDTTPAVLADPNAVQNPEIPIKKIECYKYKCGKVVYYPDGPIRDDVACEDKPETLVCRGINFCHKTELKGTEHGEAVEYIDADCAFFTIARDQETECEELSDPYKRGKGLEGNVRVCLCNTTMCNGPKSFPSEPGSSSERSGSSSSNESSSSSVLSPIAFVTFVAVFIAAKMNIF